MKNKPTLEEYFAEARRAEDIVSSDEARSLVENAPAGGPASGFFNKIKGNGPMNMITLSLAAAAAAVMIGYNAALPDNDAPIQQARTQAATSQEITKQQNQPHSDASDGQIQSGNVDLARVEEAMQQDDTQNNQNTNRALTGIANKFKKDIAPPKHEVKGVRMVELDRAQLEQLGVIFGEGNSIKFVTYKDNDNPLMIELADDNINTQFGETDDLPDVPVRFITDAEGNRRLGALAKDNSNILATYFKNGQKIHMRASNIFPADEKMEISSTPSSQVRILSKQVRINGKDSLAQVQKIESEYPEGENKSIHKFKLNKDLMRETQQIIIFNDAHIDMNSDAGIDPVINQLVEESLEEYGFPKGMKVMFVPRMKNYAFNEVEVYTSKLSRMADSLVADYHSMIENANSGNISKKELQKKINAIISEQLGDWGNIENSGISVNVKIDTIRNSAIQWNPEILEDSDMKHRIIENAFSDKKITASSDSSISLMLDGVMDDLLALERQLDEFEKINQMLPIAVDLDGGGIDYILWLEPTTDIIDRLPGDVRATLEPELQALAGNADYCEMYPETGGEPFLDIWRGCSGDVRHLKVYPNPAASDVSVEFSLAESRDVTVSLHDMFGRRIRELGKYPALGAGAHTMLYALGNPEPGMYLISIQTPNGEQAVQRVIIE
ncbi:MAG: T9SS type A sorting domain-containing protein [Candidatus Kapaibacterium sp.]